MEVNTILTVDKNCLGFTFTDSTDYTVNNVTNVSIEITDPNNVLYIINGLSLFQNNTNTRIINKDASFFNSTVLPGGVYQIVITAAYNGGSDIIEVTRNSLVFCDIKKCLLPKIGQLSANRLNCSQDKLKATIQQLYDLRIQLEAIEYEIDCGSLNTAQLMYDDLLNACNDCDCGC